MENTFHYRFFLICNELANSMQSIQPQNYAELILRENEGQYMNSQMTCYFHNAEDFLSNLIGNYVGFMWDELDMYTVAQLPYEKIKEDFDKYCDGLMALDISRFV